VAEPEPSATPADTSDGGTRSWTPRGERTAARLRQAAREVFAEHGYANARVEDVVALAGVSHGTFYTYYDNKAAILDALVDAAAARLRAVVAERWEGDDVLAVINQVIDRFVDALAEEGDVIGAWIEAAAHDQHFRDRLRLVRGEYTDTVAAHLAPALVSTGHDPVVAAGALVAMVEGYTTDRLAAAGTTERESAVRTLAALWFGGLQRLSHGA
jgi:AcrR family transcriptional regulator